MLMSVRVEMQSMATIRAATPAQLLQMQAAQVRQAGQPVQKVAGHLRPMHQPPILPVTVLGAAVATALDAAVAMALDAVAATPAAMVSDAAAATLAAMAAVTVVAAAADRAAAPSKNAAFKVDGWGGRGRTCDHGIKTRCLTTWLRPIRSARNIPIAPALCNGRNGVFLDYLQSIAKAVRTG